MTITKKKYGLSYITQSLKNTPRTGWVQKGVPPSNAETISSHLFEASIFCVELSYILYQNRYLEYSDIFKTGLLALVHDLHEAVLGDLNKFASEVLRENKIVLEKRSIEALDLGFINSILNEYLDGKTKQSHLAHICDRISTLIQAKRYMSQGYEGVREIYESSINDLESLINRFCDRENGCINLIKKFIDKIISD